MCPDDSLYRKLLPRLDAKQIECTLADWIRSTLQAKPAGLVNYCWEDLLGSNKAKASRG